MSNQITLELLSPCFCHGAKNKSAPELRIPSIRGQLRWWCRALYGAGRPEWEIFGGIGATHETLGFEEETLASPVRLWFSKTKTDVDPEVKILPHKNFRMAAIKAGGRFQLAWEYRPGTSEKIISRFERILKAWSILGGLGFRSNRAAGSVWPANASPSLEFFNTAIKDLALPVTLTVHVLDKIQDPEQLRRIACDTIKSGPRETHGRVLGYVSGSQRLASALKLKIGRFSDGHRLIAVCDRRADRGDGQFGAAIAALSGKPLGPLLSGAGV